MGSEQDHLRRLYDEQHAAYVEYVGVAKGEDLVGGQRISPERVAQFQRTWHRALAEYDTAADRYAAMTGKSRAEVTRDMLHATTRGGEEPSASG